MKNPLILVAVASLAIAAFGSAAAQEAVYELPQPVVVGKSRVAVIAELEQAIADGSLRVTELDRQTATPFVATRSRDEVRAETLAAAARGELRLIGRDSNSFDGVHRGPARTMHEVMHTAAR